MACTGVLAGSLLAVLDGGAGLVGVLPLPLVPAQGAPPARLEFTLPGDRSTNRHKSGSYSAVTRLKGAWLQWLSGAAQLQPSSKKPLEN